MRPRRKGTRPNPRIQGGTRRERRDPVVDEQQRAVRFASVALAAQLIGANSAKRRVLEERKRRHVPGRQSTLFLREHHQTLPVRDQGAQGGERPPTVKRG